MKLVDYTGKLNNHNEYLQTIKQFAFLMIKICHYYLRLHMKNGKMIFGRRDVI